MNVFKIPEDVKSRYGLNKDYYKVVKRERISRGIILFTVEDNIEVLKTNRYELWFKPNKIDNIKII